MSENIDFTEGIKKLTEEFDALIEERQDVRKRTAELKKRNDEIDRKINGIQQTLQGFSLYFNAHEAPTELTKKIKKSLAESLSEISLFSARDVDVVVAKTLTECCRDILRRNGNWMSAVQVRDALLAAKFDFSNYTSNPLTSIHTTLKRLVPEELEADTNADGAIYRWKKAAK